MNIRELGRELSLFGRQLERGQLGMIRRVASAGPKIAREVAGSMNPVPKATGAYMRGFQTRHFSKSSAFLNVEPHAQYVESGRRAGARMPPLSAIRRWLVVKRLSPAAAFPVARSIAENGIDARPVFQKTLKKLIAMMRVEHKKFVTNARRGKVAR